MGTKEEEGATSDVPLKLFLLGFLLIIVGVVVLVIAAWLRGDASISVGVIFIVGFIPVILGAGPNALFAILIAAILTIIAFIVFIWLRKKGFNLLKD